MPGHPYPLGAIGDRSGVHFALFSANAKAVALWLFGGPDGNEQIGRIPVVGQTARVWHRYLPGVRPIGPVRDRGRINHHS